MTPVRATETSPSATERLGNVTEHYLAIQGFRTWVNPATTELWGNQNGHPPDHGSLQGASDRASTWEFVNGRRRMLDTRITKIPPNEDQNGHPPDHGSLQGTSNPASTWKFVNGRRVI